MPYMARRKAGLSARSELWGLGDRLENFQPIRYTNLYGTSTMTPEGASFAPTADFAQRQREIGDFFGQSNRNLLDFNQGDASQKTLDLLRRRRATMFDSSLSNLESRLLQQGRLGLGTGGQGANPEMSGFFSAEAMADLESQILAEQESRDQGQYLYGMASGARSLFDSVADPNAASLFNTAGIIQNARTNAMQMRSQGTMALLDSRNRGADDMHQVGMQLLKWGTGDTTSANPQGSTKK